jgi:hypothetical protein
LSVAVACLAASFATIGCGGNARKAKSASGELVLNLYDTSGGVNWYDTVAGNPAARKGGGYWTGTYDTNKGDLQFGNFVLPHYGATYGTVGYWGGFTTGTNGDSSNYGYPDTSHHVGSVDWIDNQWGIMAAGGIDPLYNNPVKGVPYLIAYEGTRLDVHLANGSSFIPQEVYICAHPWPYYGNFFGDGFARPLNRPGDYFVLKITGLSGSGDPVANPIIDTLAKYDALQQYGVWQSSSWHSVNLNVEEEPASAVTLRFELETTDTGQYGPNTALYFCMDKLKVTELEVAQTGAVVRKAKPADKISTVEVKDYLPLTSYTGGEILVHDAKGKVALKTTVKAGEKINLSKLPAGEYRLRHGHRSIPIKKVGK